MQLNSPGRRCSLLLSEEAKGLFKIEAKVCALVNSTPSVRKMKNCRIQMVAVEEASLRIRSRSMKRKRAAISADSLLQIAADFPHIGDAPLQIASSACSKSPQTIKMRGWTTNEEQLLESLLLVSVRSWENVNFFDISYWERLCMEFNRANPDGRSAVTCQDIIGKGRSMKKKYDSSVTSQAGISDLSSTRPALFQLFRPCGDCLSKIPVFPASFAVPDPTDNTSGNMTISSYACTDGGNTPSHADKMMDILEQLIKESKLSDAEFATLVAKRETFDSHIARWVSAKDTPLEVVLQVLKNSLKN